MSSMDEFGFPQPVTFDEEHPKQDGGKHKGPRMLILAILAATFLAILVQLGSEIADDPPQPLRSLLRQLDHLMGNSPQAIAERFERKRQRGDLAGALNESERMIQVWPGAGHLFKGMILGEMGKTEESIAAYSNAINENCPMEATAYNNRAYARATARIDLDLALEDVEHALQIRGDEPAFLDTKGYLLYLTGDMEGALTEFDAILESPEILLHAGHGAALGEIYFHRGLVYRFLGKNDKASQDFLEARNLGFNIEGYPEPMKVSAEEDASPSQI